MLIHAGRVTSKYSAFANGLMINGEGRPCRTVSAEIVEMDCLCFE